MTSSGVTNVTGYDPFSEIPPRDGAVATEETPVVEQLATIEPGVETVQEPVIDEQPQPQTGQNRPRIKRERASTARKVSEHTPEPETDETRLVRCGFRCTPELRELLDDAAWFATGGDLSKLVRGACRREIQRLKELNNGKDLPKRPKGISPIIDDVYE